MALTTYGGLKSSVAAFLHRSDLTSVIPDFVTLAEGDISRDIRCTAMESLASGTLTGETLAFPTSFLEARRLTVGGDLRTYETPAVYNVFVDAGRTADDIYTVIGQSFYILGGTSGDTYTLAYYAMFTALANDGDTNWLLTNHPGIYLNAALKHACIYTSDDAGAAKFSALYQQAINALKVAEQRAAYTGGSLRVRHDLAFQNP